MRVSVKQLSTVLADVVLPYACFELLTKRFAMADSTALCWTAAFPGVKVAFDLIRSRRVDVVGCVVIWEICLTLALNALFHNARLILLKGPIQVAALAAACFVSLAVRRPLASMLMQMLTNKAVHMAGENVGDWDGVNPDRLRTVTLAWGLVSIADAVVRTFLIFSLPPAVYLLISRLVQTFYFTGMGIWTFRYVRASRGGAISSERDIEAVADRTL